MLDENLVGDKRLSIDKVPDENDRDVAPKQLRWLARVIYHDLIAMRSHQDKIH